jgi:rod shape determining protein RodA
MWNYKYLARIDFLILPVIFFLMIISLFIISSMTLDPNDTKEIFFTPLVKSQIKWFALGWVVFFFFAGLDYKKIQRWSGFLYFFMIIFLFGLFFTNPIQNVHRWYQLPIIGMNIQPSEYAKLIVVICLGCFLEKNKVEPYRLNVIFKIMVIVGIPFFLILKQPDLGTALILFPVTMVMCYFGKINKKFMRFMFITGLTVLLFVLLIFTNVLSHEKMRPFFTKFLKEYQYDRLNPGTYHQKASQISIALGGLSGSGWHKSEFSSKRWLPASHTDSVFSAYGEEYGFLGILFLLSLFYFLIYRSFYVVGVAKDNFGHLLSSGIAIYLAMHIIVNIAMMCGYLPISGVPLILITYGGSSVISTMAALGILQNIFTRRFMF